MYIPVSVTETNVLHYAWYRYRYPQNIRIYLTENVGRFYSVWSPKSSTEGWYSIDTKAGKAKE